MMIKKISILKNLNLSQAFTALLILFTLSASSQITKIETEKPIKETRYAPMGVYFASMKFYEDYATMYFMDAEFQHIDKMVSFSLNNEEMDNLYSLMTSSEAKKGDKYQIETLDNKTSLWINFTGAGKRVVPTLYLYESKFDKNPSRLVYMSKKKLAKLFGKEFKKKKK